MAKIPKRSEKRLFGMSNFQTGILFLLFFLLVAILFFMSFILFNNYSILEVISKFGIANPSSSIIGKWERYNKPTPTINLEKTQPNLAKPTSTLVTSIPFETYTARGNPWGSLYSDTSSTQW